MQVAEKTLSLGVRWLGPIFARRIQDYAFFIAGLGLVAVSIYAIANITVLSSDLRWSSWALSEWMIDYSSGFVRRGFAGAVMRHFWADPIFIDGMNVFLFVVFAICYLGLSLLFFLAAGINRTFVLVVAAPGSILTMAAQGEFFHRKEMLFHVTLIELALLVWSVGRGASDLHRSIVAWLVGGLSIAAFLILPLVHEAFVFLAMPAYIYVLYIASVHLRSTALRYLCLPLALVAIGQFCLAAVFRGDGAVAETIWSTISPDLRALISPHGPSIPGGGLAALQWSIGFAFEFSFEVVKRGNLWYWLLVLAIAVLSVMLVLRETLTKQAETQTGIAGVVLGIFAFSLPLYFIGGDWGRWIEAALISSFVVVFVSARTRVGLPWASLDDRLLRWAPPALFWVALVVSLTLRTPECCIQGRHSGVFGLFDALTK